MNIIGTSPQSIEIAEDRKLFAAAVTVLALSLLAIASLLGRMSATLATARNSAAPPSATPASSAPVLPTVPTPAGSDTPAPLEPTPAAIPALSPLPPFPGSMGVALTPRPLVDPATSSDRARIAAYFVEVERLEQVGAGDPQAFAKSLMETIT